MRNMVKMLSDTGPPEECEGKYASQLVPNQTPCRRRAFFTEEKKIGCHFNRCANITYELAATL
jgi:hypothetical protein